MIKIIKRFIIISLVACLVAAGIYWLVQTNPSIVSSQDGLPGGGRLRSEGYAGRDSTFSEETFLDGRFSQNTFGNSPRQGFEGGSFDHNQLGGFLDTRSFGGIVRNLLIIALTTLVVLAIQKLFAVNKRRRLTHASQ